MSTAVAVTQKDNAVLTPEVLPDQFGDLRGVAVPDLVERAKALANQVAGAQRWIEDRQKALLHDYWHFGRLCAYLYQRGEKGGWGHTVERIGCSLPHADMARKFFSKITEDRLDQYPSKTRALRDLGLLPERPKRSIEDKRADDKPSYTRTDKPKKMRVPTSWAQPVVKAIRWIEEVETFGAADLEALEALAARIEEIRSRALAAANA